jgi:hypothetical protein
MVPGQPRETAGKMKKQIVRVSALQSAKVVAMIYLVTSLPIFLLMLIPSMMGLGIGGGFSIVTLLLMVVMYTVCGFIFTLLAAWIYNLVASRVGGFEFTTVEVGAG